MAEERDSTDRWRDKDSVERETVLRDGEINRDSVGGGRETQY